MIAELQEAIQLAQENLYRGFISSKRSGIDWLNTICGDFEKLFRVLHKFLVFEGCSNVGVMEMAFLCLAQIVVCIRNLERTLVTEQEKECVLSATRQCFLDRIVWCISKIKSLAEDASSVERESTTESSFVSFLDLALNLIGPLTVAFEHEGMNQAEQDAEAMMESAKIRSVVEALITQTFAFGDVLLEKEKSQLTVICQKLLKECIALEKESSLVEGESRPNAQNRLLKASVLESAIYQLETQVNDCLLRLVYETFSELDQNLIGQMRKLVKDPSDMELDDVTNRFDTMVDRIMQIGLFAISYADNYKAASAIRSCLASIEALDSYLVPSINIPCSHHTKLLEDHWLEESSLLRYHVQRIIDSNAFALALIEILDSGIDSLKDTFTETEARNLLRKAVVYKQHLEFNACDLGLEQEPLKIHFEDFKMMILECKAIVKCSTEDSSIEQGRILKRFRILLSKLRKIQETISSGKGKETLKLDLDQKPEALAQTDEEKEVARNVKEFFSNSVLRPSMTSILYRSKRGEQTRRDTTASFLELKSFSDVTVQLRKRAETTPEKSSGNVSAANLSSRKNKLTKRNSLRVALFKRHQGKQTEEFFESFKSDMDLQITEILDQLTDLSTTFSSPQDVSIEKVLEGTEVSEKDASTLGRKSITKEEIAISDDNRITINITTEL